MREIDINEFKTRANDVLRYLKHLCEQNQIKFFLAYGTALGAVRHKGFIPWDDDIDVVMFRADYERLLEVVKVTDNSRYKLLSLDNNSKYALPLAKLIDAQTVVSLVSQKERAKLGVWVDIFVLDYVPDNIALRQKLYSKLEHLQTFWTQSIYRKKVIFGWSGNSIKSKLFYYAYTPIRLLGARFWAKEIECLSRESNKEKTDTVAVLTFTADNNREKHTYPVEYFMGGG